ncbi:MAG TPA: hypothetical protein VKM72_32375 [Thermoanaerobaculia bacterium]|nr:hypothetical protein [Thermoanaerobaculia bacterium]
MSEIHIGPHTRDDAAHGHGETHHGFDREINTKAIAKWMAGLLVLTILVEIAMWWMIRGIERFDKKKDPELTPIEQEVRQPLPPAPRLQVAPNFYRTNQGLNEGVDQNKNLQVPPDTRSDLEDMQALRADEDSKLGSPTWIDRGQGRVRVPIDVAMQVIASRGAQAAGGAPAGSVTPEEMRRQLPAGTSPGAPGATVQMTRPRPPAAQEQ